MGSTVDEVLKVLDHYEISDLVQALVYIDREGFRRYRAVEPPLSREEAETLAKLKRAIQNVGEVRDGVLRLARERRAEYLEELAKRAASEFKIKLDERTWGKMMYNLRRDLLGYGVLDPLVRDPYIEDIHVVPNVRRRVLEAVALVVLFAFFHVYPPLALAAIPALFFVLLYPVYLGWRHGVFKDLFHIVLWFVLSAALGVAVSRPLPQIWINVLVAVSTALLAHYILLKTHPHLKRRREKPAAT